MKNINRYYNTIYLEDMMLACQARDIDGVKKFIGLGTHVGALFNGKCMLHLAADNGDADMMKFLLLHGAYVNEMDDDELTPLMSAARKGDAASLRLLIDEGADIFAADLEGTKAIDYAILVEHGVDVDQRNCSSLLLAKGAGADTFSCSNLHDTTFETALRYHRSDVALAIIKMTSNVNDVKLQHGQSLLYLAVETQDLIVVDELIRRGASLDARRSDSNSLLHAAFQKGNVAIVQSLMEAGSPYTPNLEGIFPHTFAIAQGHLQVLLYLLKHQGLTPVDPLYGIDLADYFLLKPLLQAEVRLIQQQHMSTSAALNLTAILSDKATSDAPPMSAQSSGTTHRRKPYSL